MFIVFEGNNGVGKSTVINEIKEWLDSLSLPVISKHEPGGTDLGNEIRDILLHSESLILPLSQALLFSASRHQLMTTVIKPFLDRNGFVLLDRFTASTLIYQGIVGQVDMSDLIMLNNISTQKVKPDIIFFLKVDNETLLKRIKQRGNDDNFDSRPDEYHIKVNDAYEQFFRVFNGDYIEIDASKPLDEVVDSVKKHITKIYQ